MQSSLGPGSPGYRQFASYDEGEEWHTIPNGNAPILDWETGNLNIPWIHFFTFLAMRACYVAQLAYQVNTLQEQVASLESGQNDAFYLGVYNPAPFNNAGNTMFGLGATFTPVKNTHYQFFVNGSERVSGGTIDSFIAYGAGTPPARGQPSTGTQVSPKQSFVSTSTTHFDTISGTLSGLTIGQQYWLDFSVINSATTLTLTNLSISIIGLKP